MHNSKESLKWKKRKSVTVESGETSNYVHIWRAHQDKSNKLGEIGKTAIEPLFHESEGSNICNAINKKKKKLCKKRRPKKMEYISQCEWIFRIVIGLITLAKINGSNDCLWMIRFYLLWVKRKISPQNYRNIPLW